MTRHVVEVNEVNMFATGRGAHWWTIFLLAHRNTNRITQVAVTSAARSATSPATAATTPRGWPRPCWSTGCPAQR